jgi:hypothetical protein
MNFSMPDDRPAPASSVNGQSPPSPVQAGGPIIILTAARSGSTLLRFMLDAHPELACPPESGLGMACNGLARMWSVLESTTHYDGPDQWEDAPIDLDPAAMATIRHVVNGYYSAYVQRRGKARWCEKSLDNFMFAGLIGQIFPDAKFLCLYRHCMDVIASGVESSPWGLRAFGFADYVKQFPGNNVAAIAGYWLNIARSMLAFEMANPGRCLRIRYEDLVTHPAAVAGSIFSFVGAAPVPGIAETCLSVRHDRMGPADPKIWFTNRISTASLGRGVSVPVAALPPQAIEPLNQVLAELGYRPVREDWNVTVGHVDPRASVSGPDAHLAEVVGEDNGDNAIRDAVLTLLTSRLTATPSETGAFADRWPSLGGKHVHLVVESGVSPPAELGWAFGSGLVVPAGYHQPDDTDGAVNPCGLITGLATSWRAVLTGEVNMATEIIAGRMRCASAISPGVAISPEAHAIAELLGLATAPHRQMQLASDGLRAAANGILNSRLRRIPGDKLQDRIAEDRAGHRGWNTARNSAGGDNSDGGTSGRGLQLRTQLLPGQGDICPHRRNRIRQEYRFIRLAARRHDRRRN